MAVIRYDMQSGLPLVKVNTDKYPIGTIFKAGADLNFIRLRHLALFERLAYEKHPCRFMVTDAHEGSKFIPSGDVLFLIPEKKIWDYFQADVPDKAFSITFSIGTEKYKVSFDLNFLKGKFERVFNLPTGDIVFTMPLKNLAEDLFKSSPQIDMDALNCSNWHDSFSLPMLSIFKFLENYKGSDDKNLFFSPMFATSEMKISSKKEEFSPILMPKADGSIPLALATFRTTTGGVNLIVPLAEGNFSTIEYV